MSSKKDIKLMLDRLNKASNSAIKTSAPISSASPSSTPIPTSQMSRNVGNVSDGKQVIIGQGIKMSGGIDSCETLTVEGTFEATLKDAKILDISAEGSFKGDAICDEAFVYGNFEGNITVRENLFVYNGARVKGKIIYNNLITERGADVIGSLKKISKKDLEEIAPEITKAKKTTKKSLGKSKTKSSTKSKTFSKKANKKSTSKKK